MSGSFVCGAPVQDPHRFELVEALFLEGGR